MQTALEPEDVGPLNDGIMTPEYVSRTWCIAESLVKQAIDDGKLQCRMVGRRPLIEYKHALAWIRTFPFKVERKAK